MERIDSLGETDDFAIDPGFPGQRMIEILEHEVNGAFAHDKSVAICSEWPAGCSRIAGSPRQDTGLDKRQHDFTVERRFTAAGKCKVELAALQRSKGTTNGGRG